MHAPTVAASALRAECARITAAMSTLSAKLGEMKMAIAALGAAPASPQSPVMADIATLGDKAAPARVATDETANKTVSKKTMCAFDNKEAMMAVAALFADSKSKDQKEIIDALSDAKTMGAVARLFSNTQLAKTTYCVYADDLVLLTVKRMFSEPVDSKYPANAMDSSATMGAVAQLFSNAKAKQLTYDAYADDLVLLTVKRMFSEVAHRVAIDALADEGTMQAVVALFEDVSGSADQPHCASRIFVPFEGVDIMAIIKENDALTATINWVCVQPYLARSNSLGSLESVDLACSCDEILTAESCVEVQDPEAVTIALSDNAVPQKETGTPIDASFGMGAHVQQAYASASLSMLVGTALRAGLHAAFKVPRMQKLKEQSQHEMLDGCDGCTGATHEGQPGQDNNPGMTSVYDEVEIEDMEWDADARAFFFPCPCGDRFCISLDELRDGEELARCPSCSLMVRVVYDPESLPVQ